MKMRKGMQKIIAISVVLMLQPGFFVDQVCCVS